MEAQRGALQSDGDRVVVAPAFEVGAGGVDQGECRDVVNGLKHLLALAQHLLNFSQTAELKERAVAAESGTGGLVGAGAAPPLDVRDLVVEVECLLPPPKGNRGVPAGVEDHFPYVPWVDAIVVGGLVG